MKKIDFPKLIASILLPQLAGFLGSIFTITSVNSWYSTLNKPFFNPPNWLFGPVWTFLYLLMGTSLYLVWRKGFEKNKTAIYFFAAQLLLNTLWSILFFGLQSPLLAFIEIIFLWIAIVLTMKHFRKISRTAFYLLIPYILWVSFAAVLNLSIAILN